MLALTGPPGSLPMSGPGGPHDQIESIPTMAIRFSARRARLLTWIFPRSLLGRLVPKVKLSIRFAAALCSGQVTILYRLTGDTAIANFVKALAPMDPAYFANKH